MPRRRDSPSLRTTLGNFRRSQHIKKILYFVGDIPDEMKLA
jgi:hypothetical protein